MPKYDVFMHIDLLDQVPKSGAQRKNIIQFIAGLSFRPTASGDFTDRDSSMRERQVAIIGNYAVTFWVDDPVKAVMIVDVSRANH